eukprot:CAMPEP_0194756148 /NCGR_PEP_ID=MMETSP0323_2-20130528/9899_1 /TAXON_ID=2866 ORGANISM="Crypthecodinium cohnii, Strain Seligo" /NCGR_SAMPLE_ID=MMETSP0323_2 /ASSEMBLY_ACC=CAM_ASM_000346 /LENGTH=93 /DNA_ID=CAMNT_0039675529 /DNA_START=33 /DNA_END=314 /DNA_ORIENTATION=-
MVYEGSKGELADIDIDIFMDRSGCCAQLFPVPRPRTVCVCVEERRHHMPLAQCKPGLGEQKLLSACPRALAFTMGIWDRTGEWGYGTTRNGSV